MTAGYSGSHSGNSRPKFGDRGTEDCERLISEARAGRLDALESLIETWRSYLFHVAEREVSPELRPKLGASDLVQNACFDIHRRFADFRGDTAAEWRVWLKRMLVHDVLDARRRFLDAEKRDLRRERRLPDGDASPCKVFDAKVSPRASMIAEEELAALRTALGRLSPAHHMVLHLRNWECLPFAAVGLRMARSEDAVRKLWSRAVVRLRVELDAGHEPGSDEP